MSNKTDVAIVGASVAGAATAIHLARGGVKVALFDKKSFPRDKPCGEGIMPHGVRALDALGALPKLAPKDYRHFQGIEYIADDGSRARGTFPEIAPGFSQGLGIRRLRLDAAILDLAREDSNVTVFEGVKVNKILLEDGRAVGVATQAGEFTSRILVGADGRASTIRHQLGLDAPPPPRQRYGVRGHFYFENPEAIGEFVEVYRNPVGEVYTTPVSEHELLIALLMEKRDMGIFRGNPERGFRAYLDGYPHVKRRLEGGKLHSPVLTCGPMACMASRTYCEGALLVGDAAGFLDAITGEGISLALGAAELASQTIIRALEGGSASAAALAPYAVAHRALIRHYILLTKALLWISTKPRLSRYLIRRLSYAPSLFQTLLGVNCGQPSLRHLRFKDLLRFVFSTGA